jgi:cell division protein FtsB
MKNVVRRAVFLLVVAVVGVYGYLALRGPQGLPALRGKWQEIRTMEEDNANLQRENQYRRDRIKKLKENPSAQELEIRKQLKLNRPGETSFILPDQPKAAEPNSAQPKPDAPPEPK